MKAIGVTEFGGPEVLRVLDLPVPEAGPGEIRIRVHAATVNPIDAIIREGREFVADAQPPYVPGMEAAGVVDQLGDGGSWGLSAGDRVMAIAVVSGTHGAYAEYLVVPAESAVRLPRGASEAEAATLPMNGLAAQMGLDLLELPANGTVAVTGAGGAVGGYAVQLAKAGGLRVVADAAPQDQQLVTELGADVVLPRGAEFAELVRKEIPGGVDGLIDAASLGEAAARAVRDGGRISAFLGQHGTGERGILTQAVYVPAYAREHAKLDRLRQLAEDGRITMRVARTLPAEQAAEAHRLAAMGIRGRLVLTF